MTDDVRTGEDGSGVTDDDLVPEAEATDEEPSLEARLARLEQIVGALEADELELEKALALFEEGIRHVRRAETVLSETELRVEELLGDGAEGRTRPFEGDGSAGGDDGS